MRLLICTEPLKGHWQKIKNEDFRVRTRNYCAHEKLSRAHEKRFACSRVGLGIVQKFSISIPIPIPWVRYRFLNDTFSDTNFMKSVLTRLHYLKKLWVYFFQLVDIYTDSKTHLLSHCTKELNTGASQWIRMSWKSCKLFQKVKLSYILDSLHVK